MNLPGLNYLLVSFIHNSIDIILEFNYNNKRIFYSTMDK